MLSLSKHLPRVCKDGVLDWEQCGEIFVQHDKKKNACGIFTTFFNLQFEINYRDFVFNFYFLIFNLDL